MLIIFIFNVTFSHLTHKLLGKKMWISSLVLIESKLNQKLNETTKYKKGLQEKAQFGK